MTGLCRFVEWRVCGYSERRGSWQGRWTRNRESDYEVRQYLKRNEGVWFERREVVIGPVERVEIGDVHGVPNA